jgi:hypothetical protein
VKTHCPRPIARTSNLKRRLIQLKVGIVLVKLERDQEEEEVGENPPVNVEMDFGRPGEENFNSRRSEEFSSIVEAPEPEEEDEPESVGFEQDAGPKD